MTTINKSGKTVTANLSCKINARVGINSEWEAAGTDVPLHAVLEVAG